jgi:hypothetical protein
MPRTPDGQPQMVLYDRDAGQADVVGFDFSGNTNLDFTNSGWRNSWDSAVVGSFARRQLQLQVWLYDRSGGAADVVGFNSAGEMSLDTTNNGLAASDDFVVLEWFDPL